MTSVVVCRCGVRFKHPPVKPAVALRGLLIQAGWKLVPPTCPRCQGMPGEVARPTRNRAGKVAVACK